MGQYQRAIICYEQALSLAREHKDRWGEGVWLGDLGICYSELGNIGQAIEYYEQALAISREVGDRQGEATDPGQPWKSYTHTSARMRGPPSTTKRPSSSIAR